LGYKPFFIPCFRAIIFSLLLTAAACNTAQDHAPDVAHIPVSLDVRRLDQDVAALDTNNLAKSLADLSAKYPDFMSLYLDTLLMLDIRQDYSDANPGIAERLRSFLTHKDYRGLFDTVARHFPDTKNMDKDLTRGFRYLKYYYPDYPIPRVIYFVSGLKNWSAVTYEHTVGIGLDMYLGEKYPFYTASTVNIPAYLLPRQSPQYVCINVFRAIYQDMYAYDPRNKTLLDMMVEAGKEIYFLRKILPFTDDTLRLGYSQAQWAWGQENEAHIYNYFINQGLLYETNWQKILRYVTNGPTSTGMPAESPGNIGTFIGYKIISAYMAQFPNTTLQQLAALQDAQKILTDAKYKPR
jgi:hypothetical protein